MHRMDAQIHIQNSIRVQIACRFLGPRLADSNKCFDTAQKDSQYHKENHHLYIEQQSLDIAS